jgi:hypothetical protein
MTKVTPTARHRAIAAGTVGLAALGAVAGAVTSAHAADLPGLSGGLPLSTNALEAVRGLVVHNQGNVAGMPLKGLPVVGEVSQLLAAGGPAQGSPLGMLGGLAGHPGARSRVVTQPTTAAPAPAAAVVQAPQAAPMAMPQQVQQVQPFQQAPKAMQSSPLDSVSGLTGGLPLDGLASALPIGGQLTGPGKGLPLVGGLAGGLPLAGGAASLLGGLPLSSLAGGLGHLG